MIYNADDLKKAPSGGDYISDKRLALTKDGRVCDDTDPEAATLLVNEGGTIPGDVARQLGLLEEKRVARRGSPSARQGLSSTPETDGEAEDDEDDASSDDGEQTDAEMTSDDEDDEEEDEEDDEEDDEEESEPDPNPAFSTPRPSRRQRRSRN